MVDTIHINKSANVTSSLSSLMVTGSLDWTAAVWNIKSNKRLISFDYFNDVVTDVCWSNAHPAMFSGSDIEGNVGVFNIL